MGHGNKHQTTGKKVQRPLLTVVLLREPAVSLQTNAKNRQAYFVMPLEAEYVEIQELK